MDNDVLQDNNGNIVNPDNNEVLDNEVEGGVSSGTVSPGTGPGTGEYEPGEGDKDINDKEDPTLPGGGGSNPDSGSGSGSGSGSVPVLTPEKKIPTNEKIRIEINKKAEAGDSYTGYYGWTSPQTEYYCPTRGELRSNIKYNPRKSIEYTTSTDLSDDQCPTTGELPGAIRVLIIP